jgi:hypothetical protein
LGESCSARTAVSPNDHSVSSLDGDLQGREQTESSPATPVLPENRERRAHVIYPQRAPRAWTRPPGAQSMGAARHPMQPVDVAGAGSRSPEPRTSCARASESIMAMRERKRDQLTTASAISAWRGVSSPITTVHTNTLAGSCSEYCQCESRRTKSEYNSGHAPHQAASRIHSGRGKWC